MSDDIRKAIEDAQAELDECARLVDWWFESAWPDNVRRCKHRHATMVQADGQLGWMVTYQCDDCGASLADRVVTAEDIERGHDLPHFDVDLYRAGLERLDRSTLTTMAFFGQAARR